MEVSEFLIHYGEFLCEFDFDLLAVCDRDTTSVWVILARSLSIEESLPFGFDPLSRRASL
jgi:hypothetical protein